MDGTQDISGVEQVSICLRHVDDELKIHEDFVGLYALGSATGTFQMFSILYLFIKFYKLQNRLALLETSAIGL